MQNFVNDLAWQIKSEKYVFRWSAKNQHVFYIISQKLPKSLATYVSQWHDFLIVKCSSLKVWPLPFYSWTSSHMIFFSSKKAAQEFYWLPSVTCPSFLLGWPYNSLVWRWDVDVFIFYWSMMLLLVSNPAAYRVL